MRTIRELYDHAIGTGGCTSKACRAPCRSPPTSTRRFRSVAGGDAALAAAHLAPSSRADRVDGIDPSRPRHDPTTVRARDPAREHGAETSSPARPPRRASLPISALLSVTVWKVPSSGPGWFQDSAFT
jgi:hypothetical protein